jgi:alkyl hydroperoxide reductase subunit D
MSFIEVRNALPDFARDIRLNLESVLSEEGAPGLTVAQIWGVALSAGYALGTPELIAAVLGEGQLDDATVEASKAAAAIMAMNNVYYRSMHLMDDAELKKLPARLRMSVIGKPGIAKVDFELMCFAVSALAGCGQCLTAHLHELRKAGLSHEGAQSALRIASTLNAAATSLRIAAT